MLRSCAIPATTIRFLNSPFTFARALFLSAALAFANGICQSEAPAVAYATVYPLTMLLRIMVAQFLAVLLCA